MEKKGEGTASLSLPPDPGAVAGIGDPAVRAATGRVWAEWVAVLDGIGAAERPHRKLPDQEAREAAKTFWGGAFHRLAAWLEKAGEEEPEESGPPAPHFPPRGPGLSQRRWK